MVHPGTLIGSECDWFTVRSDFDWRRNWDLCSARPSYYGRTVEVTKDEGDRDGDNLHKRSVGYASGRLSAKDVFKVLPECRQGRSVLRLYPHVGRDLLGLADTREVLPTFYDIQTKAGDRGPE